MEEESWSSRIPRNLRERKERKLYSDDWALGDEEIEGYHSFDLDEKLTTEKFNVNFVKDLTEVEFNLGYIQKNGFNWPLVFRDSSQLNIVVPDGPFNINDVRMCVGSRRMVDVMDVNTQKNVEMTMKDWQRYYECQDKDKLLNVISLEFSHTRLESLVEAPKVVRQIDWVEQVWPRHLKESQTESTNVLEDMMYPKVQKYCLMSVKGCYTDFHIDFGGTSVWYHILKGKKIFWLIPPTEANLILYEKWVLSGKQSDVFFGDTVEKCARVQLEAGYTFFIPTGWIHAVYTPDDSLVFGGNFLHSFGIEKQLRIAQVEDTTHVPQKFRYPFFTEMLWYILERYVHVLLDKTHLVLPKEEEEQYEKYLALKATNNNEDKKKQSLTRFEIQGLKSIVLYLHQLPVNKKCVPDLIHDASALVRDVRTLVETHVADNPDDAITNQPILQWWPREAKKFTIRKPVGDGVGMKRKRNGEGKTIMAPPNVAKIRHRRIRCKACEACMRSDCRQCSFCMDMAKYGGPGTMKQTCKLKKCLQPTLPIMAVCYLCERDGWMRFPTTPPTKAPPDVTSSLMECSVCYKISHEKCMDEEIKDTPGIKSETSCNLWECPECIELGYNKEYKVQKGGGNRASSGGSDNAKSLDESSEAEECDIKKTKLEEEEHVGKKDLDGVEGEGVGEQPRVPTVEELQKRTSRLLIRPSYPVRPIPRPDSEDEQLPEENAKRPYTMRKAIMLHVFRHLSIRDLLNAMLVCRKWAKWSIHPSLWKKIDCTESKIGSNELVGIARRQPYELILNWCHINDSQFTALIKCIPQTRHLRLQGISWASIHPLTSPYCPVLTRVDISFCEGVNDATMKVLLAPPKYHRPGHRDACTRLRNVTHFACAGTRITNESLRLISTTLSLLIHLDLSNCQSIDEAGIAFIGLPSSLIAHTIQSLDLRACAQMTPMLLPTLKYIPQLKWLAIHPSIKIPVKAMHVWAKTHHFTVGHDEVLRRELEDPNKGVHVSATDNSKQPSDCKSKLSKKEVVRRESKKKGNNTESPVKSRRKLSKQSDSPAKTKRSSRLSLDDEEPSDSDSTSKDSPFRRSERKNKGLKYKQQIQKKDSSFEQDHEAIDESESSKTLKKDIVTRSKNSKDSPSSNKDKPSKVKTSKKTSKNANRNSQDEKSYGTRNKSVDEGQPVTSDDSRTKKTTPKRVPKEKVPPCADDSKFIRKRRCSLPLNSKLAVSKKGRKGSDSPCGSRDTSTGSSAKSDASPKERPERTHRSPRRLSTSQK